MPAPFPDKKTIVKNTTLRCSVVSLAMLGSSSRRFFAFGGAKSGGDAGSVVEDFHNAKTEKDQLKTDCFLVRRQPLLGHLLVGLQARFCVGLGLLEELVGDLGERAGQGV